jgi:DNA-3-methyladenine glycosylase II
MTDEAMRGVGLSNAKAAYAKDLATRVANGELALNRLGRRSDDAIIADLIAVKGIGRWTAEMFLIFKLGRPDIWPIDDLGIRNAVKRAYNIEPTKANLAAVAEPWRPWRSVASWYLWRSLALAAPSLGSAAATTKIPV